MRWGVRFLLTTELTPSPWNSVLLLNGKYYLNINLTIKSQLLYSSPSNYTPYQQLLYKLVLRLQVRGLGYRKISGGYDVYLIKTDSDGNIAPESDLK